MRISTDAAIPLEFIHKREKKMSHTKTCAQVFILALFIKPQTGNNPNTPYQMNV